MTLDFRPARTIAHGGGPGTMAQYKPGRFGAGNEDVGAHSALPDISASPQILIGGAFRSPPVQRKLLPTSGESLMAAPFSTSATSRSSCGTGSLVAPAAGRRSNCAGRWRNTR